MTTPNSIPTLFKTTLAALALSTTAHAAGIYTADHGDIDLNYELGDWVLSAHLGSNAIVDGSPVGNAPNGIEFDPADILVYVPNPSIGRPASALYNPIGNLAGQPLWFISAVQDPGKPFFGIGAEELDPADWVPGSIKLRLTGISGTGIDSGGKFSVWNNDSFGTPTFFYSTADGISAADELSVIAGSHGHYNIGFTAIGAYDVTVEVTGTNVADGFKTASETYHFGVVTVPEPSSALLLALGGGAFAMLRRRARTA